jgi:DNA repair exonuclease SbcCD nuclease subunit
MATRDHDDDLAMVRALAATVWSLRADALAVAGDLFDHNRAAASPAADLLAALSEPDVPVIVLPGNHDPLTPGSVYHRIERPGNVFVLGLDGYEIAVDGEWLLTGRAHFDYGDFPPLDRIAPGDPGSSAGGERIVLAHGHYDLAGDANALHRPGWLITNDDLDALDAAYVGLGHWDRAFEVRAAGPPTYYSGSPWLAATVNVVDLETGKPAVVTRVPLRRAVGTR